jgi:hypothetical protein
MDRTLGYATCVVAGREGFLPSIGSTGFASLEQTRDASAQNETHA